MIPEDFEAARSLARYAVQAPDYYASQSETRMLARAVLALMNQLDVYEAQVGHRQHSQAIVRAVLRGLGEVRRTEVHEAMVVSLPDPAAMAQQFHEAYERLAPDFGYKTRADSAKPWREVPDQNRSLMTAVCGELAAIWNTEIIESIQGSMISATNPTP